MIWVRFAIFAWLGLPALVDVAALKPGVVLDIRYATADNFTHHKLYPEPLCLLRPETARRLEQVAGDGVRLKVFDCYRPLSIQRLMWKLVPDSRYVANPATGSRHNRGAAVDVTLIGPDGRDLPMGSAYDDFSARTHWGFQGLTEEERRNRLRLRQAMTRRGFVSLDTEWWHFDDPDWSKYPVMDVPLAVSPRQD